MIPSTIHPSVRSTAEKRLFRILQHAKGTEEWICLHSLALARHARKRRGELDFVILAPQGLFVLEVKGGRVARREGKWIFTDRYGFEHEKEESPFDQASGGMFSLEHALRKEFGTDNRLGRLLMGYGVMFPDILFEEQGCDAPRELVYDIRDARNPISDYIDRVSRFAKSVRGSDRALPSRDDRNAIAKFLRGDFEAIPLLAAREDSARESLARMTDTQFLVLDSFDSQRAVIVEGGAGTGKTLLALEVARREAREGRRVLLLCFNRLLAEFLSASLENEKESIEVGSIFQKMDNLIRASSLHGEFEKARKTADSTELFSKLYPEYSQLALLEEVEAPFDVLVVDEGQDMLTQQNLDFWGACLAGSLEGGRWRIFMDSNNQAGVFGVQENAAADRLRRLGVTHHLMINCRNTVQIADETEMLACPRVKTTGVSSGLPVAYSWYSNEGEQEKKLARILRKLSEEQILPGQVTVLSPRREEACCAHRIQEPQLEKLSPENVRYAITGATKSITYASVSAFKGLENDYIVLTDIEELEADWWKSVVYVGMSRARLGLFLLVSEKARSVYEARLRSWASRREATYRGGEQ